MSISAINSIPVGINIIDPQFIGTWANEALGVFSVQQQVFNYAEELSELSGIASSSPNNIRGIHLDVPSVDIQKLLSDCQSPSIDGLQNTARTSSSISGKSSTEAVASGTNTEETHAASASTRNPSVPSLSSGSSRHSFSVCSSRDMKINNYSLQDPLEEAAL